MFGKVLKGKLDWRETNKENEKTFRATQHSGALRCRSLRTQRNNLGWPSRRQSDCYIIVIIDIKKVSSYVSRVGLEFIAILLPKWWVNRCAPPCLVLLSLE